MDRISFKENDISQRPAIELLQKLGYQYISPDEALTMRGGKTSNVLLEEVLRRQLRELNSIRIGTHKEARFSEQNIENGVIAMRNVPMEGGYLSGNEAVYNMLTLGKAFEQSIDGDKKSFTMRYIDWEHSENNVYHVTEEFAVTRTGSSDTYRPDIVLFVNGIPLVIIECKRPDIKGAEEQAISQHLRNQKDDGIRGLYVYSSLLLAIGNNFGSYGTTGSAAKFWGKWREMHINKDEELEYKKCLLDIVNKDNEEIRATTPQDEYIYNLCRPERLLELTYHFTLFDAGIKKLARYQQYFTVKEVVERVKRIDTGKRNGGVVWHTQGSGKSLTMVLLAQKIATVVQNPRIYDFDGTLSPGNMQEFGFIQAIGKDKTEFWTKNKELSEKNDANGILCYMYLMIQAAKTNGISLKRDSFKKFGADVELFEGVKEWFSLINEYGNSIGLEIKHYINSSGLKEMIEGTAISKEFENIYACSFLYDVDGIAYWPGVAVDYTTKTQFLFKINKGIKEVSDNRKINEYVPEAERPIPFERMIYFGDGETDIPCMRTNIPWKRLSAYLPTYSMVLASLLLLPSSVRAATQKTCYSLMPVVSMKMVRIRTNCARRI